MKTLTIDVGNVSVQLIAEGDTIARMMLNGKVWEPYTRAAWGLLVQRCTPIDLVLDVGAYSGVYAIASALMGWKVMALEPHPTNYARLLRNAALNSMRIDARPLAASNVNGTKTLHTKKPVEVMSDTASLLDGGQAHSIEVPTRRIDDLPLGGARVGLLKIDAEHHELDVLLGAKQMLETHKPLVVVETLNTQAYDVVSMQLMVSGYRRAGILDGRNAVYELGV